MKRRVIISGLVVVVLVIAGVLSSENVTRLDFTDPGREMWQRPADLVSALDIEFGQKVADIGAGEGYFIPYLKVAVGAKGEVFAVDVEEEITAKLKGRFTSPTITVIKGDYDDPLLPDGAVDLVLLVNTYHHIQDRPAYFAKLKQDLAPGGRIVIVEPNIELSGLLGLFVDEEHASNIASVREEMGAAGYVEQAAPDFLPVQFMVMFVPE